jgi:hypothetical protein
MMLIETIMLKIDRKVPWRNGKNFNYYTMRPENVR